MEGKVKAKQNYLVSISVVEADSFAQKVVLKTKRKELKKSPTTAATNKIGFEI